MKTLVIIIILSLNALIGNAQWILSESLIGGYEIAFPAPKAAYIVGDLGKLYKSTDSGMHWTEQYDFGPFSSLQDVQFFNADTGIVSNYSAHQITFDGGFSWDTVSNAKKLKIYNNKIYATHNSNDTAYIMLSSDYGSTWTTLYERFQSDAQAYQIAIPNDTLIYFINPLELDRVYKTTNNFSTIDTNWITNGDLVLQEKFDFMNNGKNGFLYGSLGSMSHPTHTWNIGTFYFPMDLDGFGVLPVFDLALNTTNIYAASLYGKIYTSSTNGATWLEQNTPINVPIYSIAMLNDSVGIAVSDDKIIYTTNGGESTTGIKSKELHSKIKVYPNPFNTTINIATSTDVKIQKVELFDINGRSIKPLNTPLNSLQLNNLSAGHYIIFIETNLGKYFEKITKQ